MLMYNYRELNISLINSSVFYTSREARDSLGLNLQRNA